MTQEEKVLILGALFHDIGKFEQRCTNNPTRETHQVLGVRLISEGRFQDRFGKIIGPDNIKSLKNIIQEHHNKNAEGLTRVTREADRLSASERVDKEEVEVYQDQWKHKHLASLFSKIYLLAKDKIQPRYYKHKQLTKNEFDIIIPLETNEDEIKAFSYNESNWSLFNEDLEYVLDIYKSDEDFESLVNLLLIIFEKYMWCIPDFTGSSQTDISLYNHLKDTAGFAHAIYLTQQENPDSTKLNLVIGDMPGIQDYIFNVVNRKPAKILRGRSIYVQLLTRNFATKLLKSFGLTEVNLIMNAGGKFYIIAPDTAEFQKKFNEAKKDIEEYLFDNFRMELSFNCAYHNFDYSELMKKDKLLTFGQIVEGASHKLIENRYNLFYNRLFENGGIVNKNYVWGEEYIDDDGTGTDSIKCRVTDKPIRIVNGKSRERIIKDPPDNDIVVDVQVKNEYEIGSKITGNDIIVVLEEDGLSINPDNIFRIRQYKEDGKFKERIKILLNPTFTEQLKKQNLGKDVFRNTYYLEAANYCSRNNDNVMDFEKISKNNEGAEFLTLIKGDIDNLGLIMAYGLTRDKNDDAKEEEKDLTAISRTTTLSNHLKYFFSFFLNGFLKDWENKSDENKVYTIFAGGDDLMLIAPQSSAVKLIKALNDKFNEFVCSNNEVHISYSITHFKDHTPIRIIAELADENQKEGKKFTMDKQKELLRTKKEASFLNENDKAGTFFFNAFVKNHDLDYLIKQIEDLTLQVRDEKTGLSHGLIRRLLELSESMKKYEETNDASYLIAYARLNYSVNRLLKDSSPEIKLFFKNVLIINKIGNEEAQKLKKILHPLVCQVIYNIRKNL